MRSDRGLVRNISASGLLWSGHKALDIRTMFFQSLKSARRSISISAFSMGKENPDVEEFFKIIEKKLDTKRIPVMIIVNDDENLHKYSNKKLDYLENKYPECFTLRKFDPYRHGKKNKMILHSKITIIDSEFALVGSANISQSALENNYEIMLKISGQTVSIMNTMMLRLSKAIEDGEEY